MMERGIATKIEGRLVTVSLGQGEGCAACAAHDECHSAGQSLEAELPDGFELAAGDEVTIEIPDATRVEGLALALGLPLTLLVGGYLAGEALMPGRGEGPGAVGGVLGLAIGLAVAALVSRRGRMARRPRIVRPDGAGLNPDAPDPD